MNESDVVRWFSVSMLALVYLYLFIGNWRIVLGKRNDSWIPIIGGLVGVLALFIAPVSFSIWIYVVVVSIEWGSFIGIVHAVWWHLAQDQGRSNGGQP